MFGKRLKNIVLVCTTSLFLLGLFAGFRLMAGELPPIQTRVMVHTK